MKKIFFLWLVLTITNKATCQHFEVNGKLWSTQNLNVDHYSNGDIIPQVQDPKEWENLKTGAWCYYENKTENGTTFGKLYNLYAVLDPRGLAPKGWRIPTRDDWDDLFLNTRGEGTLTSKEAFSINYGGLRYTSGDFGKLNTYGFYWTSSRSSEEYVWAVDAESGKDYAAITTAGNNGGRSVRCVKDK